MTVKVPNKVQMRLILYRSKMETFMFVAEFQYARFTYAYIFYLLLKTGQCATKKLNWHQIDRQRQPFGTIAQMTVKEPNMVQMRLILYRSKMETFMFVAEFQYARFTHTYIFYLLLKTGQCATKKLKS